MTRAGAEPFESAGRSPGVVLLHGLTGTPYEVRPIAQALADRGLAVYAPLLPGHGGRSRDVERVSADDWVGAASAAFDGMRKDHDRVVVGGLSMGAVLALYLAAERGDQVDRIVAMAPALSLGFVSETLLRTLGRLSAVPDWYVPKFGPGDVGPTPLGQANPGNRASSVRAAFRLVGLADRVRAMLPRVRQPILILHGRRDRTIPVRVAQELYEQVGSVERRLVVFDRSRHLLPLDVEGPDVVAEVVRFVTAGADTRRADSPRAAS